MFGNLIDSICQELKVSVAFLSADGGVPVFFPAKVGRNFATVELARSFYDARLNWVREWKPDAVLVFERWDIYSPKVLHRELPKLILELESHARHLVLFSQVPVLQLGETENLRELITARRRLTGLLPDLLPNRNEAVRKFAIAEIENLAKTNPKIQLVRADLPFYFKDGSIKYASGRTFYYLDDDHLTQAGAELLRETLRRTIVAVCDL